MSLKITYLVSHTLETSANGVHSSFQVKKHLKFENWLNS